MSEPRTRFVVGGREAGRRLDRFLQEQLPRWSRTRIQRTIRERVRLSWGVDARPATPVRAGGEITIDWQPPEERLLETTIPLLAEGPGWLAVDKPPGIPVHPVNREFENTIVRMLRRQRGEERLSLAHRLDRDTSGVLLLSRDAEHASRLQRAFLDERVHKEYLAVVRGVPAQREGEIDLAIGEDDASRVHTRRTVREDGQPALTRWRLEQSVGDRALLRLFPRSGRRHQLRVHLEAIGHPILGDLLYGRDDAAYLRVVAGEGDARLEEGGARRQLLHCARLVLPELPELEAPLPADFTEALA